MLVLPAAIESGDTPPLRLQQGRFKFLATIAEPVEAMPSCNSIMTVKRYDDRAEISRAPIGFNSSGVVVEIPSNDLYVASIAPLVSPCRFDLIVSEKLD